MFLFPLDPRDYYISNPLFDAIKVEFERDYNIKIYDIPINFHVKNIQVAGSCVKYNTFNYQFREIHINPIWWDTYNEYTQKRLIYHELGHCITYMQLNHVNDPWHLMYPYNIPIYSFMHWIIIKNSIKNDNI